MYYPIRLRLYLKGSRNASLLSRPSCLLPSRYKESFATVRISLAIKQHAVYYRVMAKQIQAVRIVNPNNPPAVDSILPPSWHPVSDCDWVCEDTELDGACGFELGHRDDPDSLIDALGYAGCYWPGRQLFALIEGYRGESNIPEQGACTVCDARVIGLFWWEC